MADVEFTSEEITGAIVKALRAQDMQAVVRLMHMLAVVDPETAAHYLRAFEHGSAIVPESSSSGGDRG